MDISFGSFLLNRIQNATHATSDKIKGVKMDEKTGYVSAIIAFSLLINGLWDER